MEENQELLILNVTSQLLLDECKKYHEDRQGH